MMGQACWRSGCRTLLLGLHPSGMTKDQRAGNAGLPKWCSKIIFSWCILFIDCLIFNIYFVWRWNHALSLRHILNLGFCFQTRHTLGSVINFFWDLLHSLNLALTPESWDSSTLCHTWLLEGCLVPTLHTILLFLFPPPPQTHSTPFWRAAFLCLSDFPWRPLTLGPGPPQVIGIEGRGFDNDAFWLGFCHQRTVPESSDSFWYQNQI